MIADNHYIFSEIGKFFKENDATSARNAIMDMTKALRGLQRTQRKERVERNHRLKDKAVRQVV